MPQLAAFGQRPTSGLFPCSRRRGLQVCRNVTDSVAPLAQTSSPAPRSAADLPPAKPLPATPICTATTSATQPVAVPSGMAATVVGASSTVAAAGTQSASDGKGLKAAEHHDSQLCKVVLDSNAEVSQPCFWWYCRVSIAEVWLQYNIAHVEMWLLADICVGCQGSDIARAGSLHLHQCSTEMAAPTRNADGVLFHRSQQHA